MKGWMDWRHRSKPCTYLDAEEEEDAAVEESLIDAGGVGVSRGIHTVNHKYSLGTELDSEVTVEELVTSVVWTLVTFGVSLSVSVSTADVAEVVVIAEVTTGVDEGPARLVVEVTARVVVDLGVATAGAETLFGVPDVTPATPEGIATAPDDTAACLAIISA